jgi:hypothetical protein
LCFLVDFIGLCFKCHFSLLPSPLFWWFIHSHSFKGHLYHKLPVLFS